MSEIHPHNITQLGYGVPDDMSQASSHHLQEPKLVLLKFVILLVLMAVLQTALEQWRKNHSSSFKLATMLIMWLVPFLLACLAFAAFWRYIAVWTLFSLCTLFVCYLVAIKRPLLRWVPRITYRYFSTVYRVCHIAVLAAIFVDFPLLLLFARGPESFLARWSPNPFFMIFYGLYFGVLCRDCAEICASMMNGAFESVRKSAYTSEPQLATRCAVCDDQFEEFEGIWVDSKQASLIRKQLGYYADEENIRETDEDGDKTAEVLRPHKEKVLMLDCGHRVHEACLRGWCIVGKKDSCPICAVRFKKDKILSRSVWQSNSQIFKETLDFVRFMFSWNPIFFLFFIAYLRIVF